MNLFLFMKKKKKWFLIPLIAIPLIILGFLMFNKKPAVEYSTVQAKEDQLLQTVSESGTVKPVKELALNFLTSGRIKEINVKVGDKVTTGQALASLDDSGLQTRKTEAEAALSVAQASLSKLLAGAGNATINVSLTSLNQAQVVVSSAKIDLDKTKKTVAENIRQAEKSLADLESSSVTSVTPQEQAVSLAQTAYDNAKKNGQKSVDNARSSAVLTISDKIITAKIALDNVNTLLEDEDAKNVLGVKNSIIINQTKTSRQTALALVSKAETAINLARNASDESSVASAGQSAKELLLAVKQTFDYAYALLEASVVSSDFTQTKLDSYKSMVSSQLTQISAATSAVEGSLQTLSNASLSYETSLSSANDNLQQAKVNLENARISARNNLSSLRLSGDQQIAAAQARLDNANKSLAVAQAQYENTVAPARSQDIAVAQAQVKQAEASLEGINRQIADSLLVAPVDGVVNQVNYEAGEQFGSSGRAVVSLLVDNSFNIEVDISESNISKVKAGDAVEITLDAFPADLILPGRVSFIEPAQTVIQDVVYYKVKIDFENLENTRLDLAARNLSIKSGMTANVVIMTEKLDKVVQIPARAVIDKDGQKIVRVLRMGEMAEVPVKVGLQGDEGMLEIKEGLAAGEEVITFIRNGEK